MVVVQVSNGASVTMLVVVVEGVFVARVVVLLAPTVDVEEASGEGSGEVDRSSGGDGCCDGRCGCACV